MSLKLTTKNHWLKVVLVTFFASLNIALNHFGYAIFESTQSSANLWLTLFFAIALFLPFWSFRRLVLLIIFLLILLNILNDLKLRFLNHAISEYDFKTIASAPSYWLDAIFGYGFWHYFAVVFLSALAVFLIIKNYRQIGLMTLAVIIFYGHYALFQKNLSKQPDNHDVLGSIVYSGSEAYFKNMNSLLKKEKDVEVVDEKEIENAAKKYRIRADESTKPNIIFVLAESTFNPNETFILRKKYLDNSLFFNQKNEYYGRLGVSANGGVTWVSEFETISGISTKALGFEDHINGLIVSRIRTSFARYLKEKNYHSTAFFPTLGSFIDSAETYKKNYAFDEIKDLKTLDLEAAKTKPGFDLEMIKKVVEKVPQESLAPFFYYVILSENRGPHYCKREFLREENFRFSNDSSFDRNCEFDEYLKRAKSTESAIKLLHDQMKKIELKNGKPFLIVIFGDRQPWIFNAKGYDINRISGSSRYVTFYKIIKSDSLPALKLPEFIPSNLLPSLVSTALEQDPKKFFIPENFYLFEKCGAFEDADDCANKLDSKHLDYSKYFNF